MKVLAIVSEYNPFHYGHKYHIEESKKITGADYVIALMSGSFVQRGEPAFLDKWSRSQMALEGGCDLVLELPFAYASSTAEKFADGAIRLLDSLSIVDYVSFGAEEDNLELLREISKSLAFEDQNFKSNLRFYLDSGLSFPRARAQALSKSFKQDLGPILESPNNILALEYLKSMYKIDTDMEPVVIRRKGSGYKETELKNFASATAIRNSIRKEGLASVKTYLPAKSYEILTEFQDKYSSFNYLSNYQQLVFYSLGFLDQNSISNFPYADFGTGQRILKNLDSSSLEELIDKSVSKSHTRSRIQRILVHILHNFTMDDFTRLDSLHPNYVRVLATNEKGFRLLREISKKSELPLVTKYSSFLETKGNKELIKLDEKSTDLFFLGLDSPRLKMDYFKSPLIKKE